MPIELDVPDIGILELPDDVTQEQLEAFLPKLNDLRKRTIESRTPEFSLPDILGSLPAEQAQFKAATQTPAEIQLQGPSPLATMPPALSQFTGPANLSVPPSIYDKIGTPKLEQIKGEATNINRYFDLVRSAVPWDDDQRIAEIEAGRNQMLSKLNEEASLQGLPFSVAGVAPEKPFVEPVTSEEYEWRTGIGGIPGQVLSGMQQVGAGFLEMFKDPLVLTAAAPGIAAKLGLQLGTSSKPMNEAVARAFGVQMLSHSPGLAKSAYDAWKKGDIEGAVRDIGNFGISAGLGTKLTLGPEFLMKGVRPGVLNWARNIQERERLKYASSQQEAAAVHGNVLDIEGKVQGEGEVPADVSGERVPTRPEVVGEETQVLLKRPIGDIDKEIAELQQDPEVRGWHDVGFNEDGTPIREPNMVNHVKLARLRDLIKARNNMLDVQNSEVDAIMLELEEVAKDEAKKTGNTVEIADPGDPNVPFSQGGWAYPTKEGNIGIIREKFRSRVINWMRKGMTQTQIENAMRNMVAHERIHTAVEDSQALDFYNNATALEKMLALRKYTGFWTQKGYREITKREITPELIGHEMIRSRMQKLLGMKSGEIVDTVGKEQWTVRSIEALENIIQWLRTKTKASQRQLAILDEVSKGLEIAKVAAQKVPPMARMKEGTEDDRIRLQIGLSNNVIRANWAINDLKRELLNSARKKPDGKKNAWIISNWLDEAAHVLWDDMLLKDDHSVEKALEPLEQLGFDSVEINSWIDKAKKAARNYRSAVNRALILQGGRESFEGGPKVGPGLRPMAYEKGSYENPFTEEEFAKYKAEIFFGDNPTKEQINATKKIVDESLEIQESEGAREGYEGEITAPPGWTGDERLFKYNSWTGVHEGEVSPGVYVDYSLVRPLQEINAAGWKTLFSDSGMDSDHIVTREGRRAGVKRAAHERAMVMFSETNPEAAKMLKSAVENAGWRFSEMDYDRYVAEIFTTKDSITSEAWKRLVQNLKTTDVLSVKFKKYPGRLLEQGRLPMAMEKFDWDAYRQEQKAKRVRKAAKKSLGPEAFLKDTLFREMPSTGTEEQGVRPGFTEAGQTHPTATAVEIRGAAAQFANAPITFRTTKPRGKFTRTWNEKTKRWEEEALEKRVVEQRPSFRSFKRWALGNGVRAEDHVLREIWGEAMLDELLNASVERLTLWRDAYGLQNKPEFGMRRITGPGEVKEIKPIPEEVAKEVRETRSARAKLWRDRADKIDEVVKALPRAPNFKALRLKNLMKRKVKAYRYFADDIEAGKRLPWEPSDPSRPKVKDELSGDLFELAKMDAETRDLLSQYSQSELSEMGKGAAEYREKLTRYRQRLMSEIYRRQMDEANEYRKPVDRIKIDMDDVDFENRYAAYNPWMPIEGENLSPENLFKILKDEARSTGDPLTYTKSLVALVDKKSGRVHLVSAYPRFKDIRIRTPGATFLSRFATTSLSELSKNWRPFLRVLIKDPVENFDMAFKSMSEFNQKFMLRGKEIADQVAWQKFRGEEALPEKPAEGTRTYQIFGQEEVEAPIGMRPEDVEARVEEEVGGAAQGVRGEGGIAMGPKAEVFRGESGLRPWEGQVRRRTRQLSENEVLSFREVMEREGGLTSPSGMLKALQGLKERYDTRRMSGRDWSAITAIRKAARNLKRRHDMTEDSAIEMALQRFYEIINQTKTDDAEYIATAIARLSESPEELRAAGPRTPLPIRAPTEPAPGAAELERRPPTGAELRRMAAVEEFNRRRFGTQRPVESREMKMRQLMTPVRPPVTADVRAEMAEEAQARAEKLPKELSEYEQIALANDLEIARAEMEKMPGTESVMAVTELAKPTGEVYTSGPRVEPKLRARQVKHERPPMAFTKDAKEKAGRAFDRAMERWSKHGSEVASTILRHGSKQRLYALADYLDQDAAILSAVKQTQIMLQSVSKENPKGNIQILEAAPIASEAGVMRKKFTMSEEAKAEFESFLENDEDYKQAKVYADTGHKDLAKEYRVRARRRGFAYLYQSGLLSRVGEEYAWNKDPGATKERLDKYQTYLDKGREIALKDIERASESKGAVDKFVALQLRGRGKARLAEVEKLQRDLDFFRNNINNPELIKTAQEVARAFDEQFERELAAGYSPAYDESYWPGRYDAEFVDDNVLKFGRVRILGRAWNKNKKFQNRFEAIADDSGPFISITHDSSKVVAHRIRQGMRAIAKLQFIDAAKQIVDPVSGKKIVTPLIRRRGGEGTPQVPNPAYEEVKPFGKNQPGIAVRIGYKNAIEAILNPSWIDSVNTLKFALEMSQRLKHTLLVGDFFHLGRVNYYAMSMMGIKGAREAIKQRSWKPLYEKGLSVLDLDENTLRQSVDAGVVKPDVAKWAMDEVAIHYGDKITRVTRMDLARMLRSQGLNVGRITDAIYKDLAYNIPFWGESKFLKKTVGRYNEFLFDRMTRGVMMEAAIQKFEEYNRKNPDIHPRVMMRDVVRDVNRYFGSIGRQGVFKSRTAMDIMRMLFLAPQWVEGLMMKEAGFATRLGAMPLRYGARAMGSELPYRRGLPGMGVTGESIGRGLVSMFVLTQVLNFITTGHSTFQNEEGHKLDAWLPDVTGKTDGFYFSPMSVFNELSHDLYRYLDTKKSWMLAGAQIAQNKMHGFTRSMLVPWTRSSLTGQRLNTSGEITAEMALQFAPVPITFGKVGQAIAHKATFGVVPDVRAGVIQRQAVGSLGIKIEPARSASARMIELAKEWREKNDMPSMKGWELIPTKEASYSKLRGAIRSEDWSAARKIYKELRKSEPAVTKRGDPIIINMMRWSRAPFTGNQEMENQFRSDLTKEQERAYDKARDERFDLMQKVIDFVLKQPD